LRALVGHLLSLHLAGDLSGTLIGGFLFLTTRALVIEVALKLDFAVFIRDLRDLLFEVFLVVALISGLGFDLRGRVIAEGTEPAAVELKLNHIFLHNDGSYPGSITFADGRAGLLNATRVLLPVHWRRLVQTQIYALLSAGHVDLQYHFLACE
jgi:hypothetical protein